VLQHVQFRHAPEVVPVDGEGHGLRQQVRPHEEGPGEKPPVLEPLPSGDAETQRGAHHREDTLQVHPLNVPPAACRFTGAAVLGWSVPLY
jgi:hypothetical protein